MKCEECFFGSATVGERGQIVIPADARSEMGINPGDKILIMKHPIHMGLMLFKIESARSFLDDFGTMLTKLDGEPKEEGK